MNESIFPRVVKFTLIIGCFLSLTACHNNSQTAAQTKQPTIVTASLQTPVTQLYFTGSISPIETEAVFSPVDGTISKMYFHYGERVSKGASLVEINSTQVVSDYQKAVTDFLTKKSAYLNAVLTYEGSKALYKAGVNSEEQYNSDKSSYENSVLDYYQSKIALERILQLANISVAGVESLTVADKDKISSILEMEYRLITVKSPGDGVVLFPLDDDSSSSDDGSSSAKSSKMMVGSALKKGDRIISLGDLSGFSIPIQVSEININQVTAGMPATVTGDAFPGMTLQGKVSVVSSQAKPGQSDSSSLSTFAAMISVPTLSEQAKKTVRVGMTAKVEIDLKGKPSILLPIAAVQQNQGQNVVTLQLSGNQTKQVPVTTGDTTPDGNVVIVSGVKVGDKVIVND